MWIYNIFILFLNLSECLNALYNILSNFMNITNIYNWRVIIGVAKWSYIQAMLVVYIEKSRSEISWQQPENIFVCYLLVGVYYPPNIQQVRQTVVWPLPKRIHKPPAAGGIQGTGWWGTAPPQRTTYGPPVKLEEVKLTQT